MANNEAVVGARCRIVDSGCLIAVGGDFALNWAGQLK